MFQTWKKMHSPGINFFLSCYFTGNEYESLISKVLTNSLNQNPTTLQNSRAGTWQGK